MNRISKVWNYVTRVIPQMGPPYVRNLLGSQRYPLLSESELMATRTSDTAFVFGSGYSLNHIDPETWEWISKHDTVSFREFPRQDFVRADYHVTAEVDDLAEYTRLIRENRNYTRTIFVIQEGWTAWHGNNIVGRGLLNAGSRVVRFKRTGRGVYRSPSRTLSEGLIHGYNSSISTTNFAIVMGWKNIVLTGIDLYDKRYFWLPPDTGRSYEKPGVMFDAEFTNASPIVDYFGRWRDELEPDGIKLWVMNPKSLLANVLPVYESMPSSVQTLA